MVPEWKQSYEEREEQGYLMHLMRGSVMLGPDGDFQHDERAG